MQEKKTFVQHKVFCTSLIFKIKKKYIRSSSLQLCNSSSANFEALLQVANEIVLLEMKLKFFLVAKLVEKVFNSLCGTTVKALKIFLVEKCYYNVDDYNKEIWQS